MLRTARKFVFLCLAVQIVAFSVGLSPISIGVPPARAQGTAEAWTAPRIAVLDLQKIFAESTAVQEINRTRAEYLQKYRQAAANEESDLRAAESELRRQRSLLAPDAFEQQETEFKDRAVAYQRKVQEQVRRVDLSFAQAMQRVRLEIARVVDDIAKENGINVVVAKEQTFMFTPEINISDRIIARLNERLPAVEFADPESHELNASGAAQ